MNIAILESTFMRRTIAIIIMINTFILPSVYLEPILEAHIFFLISLLLTILLLLILSKIIESYKIIGTIELNNDQWLINNKGLKNVFFIHEIKKINLIANLGISKFKAGRTSFIATILLKNNESYVLEISREEFKNGKLLSTNIFNMNSRFDLFTYLKKKRIKYELK